MSLNSEFAKTVVVLFGGRTSEHEISLRSAVYVLKNFPLKYNIIPVGIDRNGMFFSLEGSYKSKDFENITSSDLAKIVEGGLPQAFSGKRNLKSCILPFLKSELEKHIQEFPFRVLNLEASCVFPVLHGQNGEDGRFQGLLELAEIAYVGCDLRSSVVGIDKDIAKRLVQEAGIPVARYEVLFAEEYQKNSESLLKRIEKSIGYPCFVKPNSLGSAVGTGKAKNREDLKRHIQEALAFDQKALVEEVMQGTEVECAFLGSAVEPQISVAGEISTNDFYSYEEKYSENSHASLHLPARLSQEKMLLLQNSAKKVARILGIEGLCRIDFWRCKKNDRFVFNEINTLPGLTSISMFPKLWEYEGISGEKWIEQIIEQAYKRAARMAKSQYGIKATI